MSYSPYYFAQQSKGTVLALVTSYTNASAVTAIPQGQACSVTDTTGKVSPLDVSSSTSVKGMVGFANTRIPTSALGSIIANGRLENFTTALPIGTALYVGTDGNPTEIVPSIGVNGFTAGMTVIFIGILVKNESNPSHTDIQLMTHIVGKL